jgi:hypothetical protein
MDAYYGKKTVPVCTNPEFQIPKCCLTALFAGIMIDKMPLIQEEQARELLRRIKGIMAVNEFLEMPLKFDLSTQLNDPIRRKREILGGIERIVG